jgi:hypothetical protein
MVEEKLERIEVLLLEMRGKVARLEALLAPKPTAMRYAAAAKEIGIGLTALKAMVRRREIRTTKVGRVPMISLAEIERVTTPTQERPRVEAAARAKAWQPIPKKKSRR